MGGETLWCLGCWASLAPSQLYPKSGDQWEPPHHPPSSMPGMQSLSIPAWIPHQPGPLLSSTRAILPIFAGKCFPTSITFQDFFFFLMGNNNRGLARNPTLLGINLPRWHLFLVMVRNQPVPHWVGCWKLWFWDLCWWQMVRSCQLSANALKK